ncbi:hypothetical protein LEMLEM_LOCUS2641 [Lemmus lemmus]
MQTLKFRNLFCAPAKTDLFLSGRKICVLGKERIISRQCLLCLWDREVTARKELQETHP